MPVLRAAEEEGRLDGLTVVTTDLFPELVDFIRAGKVAATVYQRPLTQGRVALQALYQYLQQRHRMAVSQRVVPYVVMRSNLDLVLERLSVDRLGALDAVSGRGEKRPHAARPRATTSRRTNA
jgi:LacI family transcriptional regulator